MSKQYLFSALKRNEILNQIISNKPDVLIIGGGITGAGIALDAISRGLSVSLIEKADFANGTSSKSTKLVHGGLRYLEQLEFNLVRKVGKERNILHKNAPHLVIPQKMLLPVIKNGKLNKLGIFAGLTIYDFLAGVIKKERKKMLSKKRILEQEPLLQKELIKGGAIYYEYTTNDARLTIEILKKAVELGALAINYLEAKKFTYHNKKIIGVEVNDIKINKNYQLFAKGIINATGPWLDKVRDMDSSNQKKLFLTKGIHICFDYEKLPLNQAVYFDTPDKRMIFAIPNNNYTYIGTTDTSYNEDLDTIIANKKDIEYLINSTNKIFNRKIKIPDIISSWSGLRPLIYKGEKNPSEISRKDEIFISKTGLISIAGGKLTGYRLMAKKAVDTLLKKNTNFKTKPFVKCQTKNISLSGGEFSINKNLEKTCMDYHKNLKTDHYSYEDFRSLFFRYGNNTQIIISKALDYSNNKIPHPLIKAELWYNINYEMLSNLSDYFTHRTNILYFYPKIINNKLDHILTEMSSLLNWTSSEEKMQKDIFLRIKKDCISF